MAPTQPYSGDSSEVEIIQDSEPERQEKKTHSRAGKSRSQQAVLAPSQPISSATPSWISTALADSQSTLEHPPSAVSTKPPTEDSQELNTLPVTASAPGRQVAPPPWLVTQDPLPDPQVQPTPSSSPRPKSSSQPSPVKQLDINSFAFRKRPSGVRSKSYSASSRSVSSSKATDQESSIPSIITPAPTAKPTARPTAKPTTPPNTFRLDATKTPGTDPTFTSEQISSLTSCVVCGNSWTVRKQAKSKWSHINQCARKHGCGTETLYMKLLTAVVDASEEKAQKAAAAKAKGKEKEPVGPQSLLSHTVQERAPAKRRGRRKEPGPSSLHSIEEAQKSILQRSATLLGADVPLQDENERPEEVQRADSPEEAFIPATQVFAPSKIGGRSKFFGSTTSVLNDSASGLLYVDEPRSFLSGPRASSPLYSPPLSVSSGHDIHHRSISPPLSINSSIISITSSNHESTSSDLDVPSDRARSPARSDSSGSVLILDASFRGPVDIVDTQPQDDDDEWDSRDGVFLWDDYAENEVERPTSPADSLVNNLLALDIREPQDDAGNRGRGRSPRRMSTFLKRSGAEPLLSSRESSFERPLVRETSRSTHRGGSTSSERPLAAKAVAKVKTKTKPKRPASPPPPKPKSKPKTKSKPAVQETEEETEEPNTDVSLSDQMLSIIMGNEKLYLRILRYEPIKFEDLFDMAIANGIPKHGLQIKLKAFLDAQCINFYSEDNLGRRKRR